jgi:hypothetical protein
VILLIVLATSAFGQTAKGLTLADVQAAFEKASLPMSGIVAYDEESDPNDQIGRPNGYVAKASWYDERMERQSASPDCTIEIFANARDLTLRKRHLDQVYKTSPILSTYVFIHRNVMLRLPKALLPKQAAGYETALKSLK